MGSDWLHKIPMLGLGVVLKKYLINDVPYLVYCWHVDDALCSMSVAKCAECFSIIAFGR